MTENVIILGIAGASASGKSLLARSIVNELGIEQVAVISQDSYYKDNSHLSFEERGKLNYDHPEQFDHDLLHKHLLLLQAGQTVNIPIYDHSRHNRSNETREVNGHRIIIIEGIMLFVEKKLREMMDIKIFMNTALDICFIRRLERDLVQRERTLTSVIEQYQTTVRPMYWKFVEPSSRYADVIVPRGGENRIAIEMIQAKLRELTMPFRVPTGNSP